MRGSEAGTRGSCLASGRGFPDSEPPGPLGARHLGGPWDCSGCWRVGRGDPSKVIDQVLGYI